VVIARRAADRIAVTHARRLDPERERIGATIMTICVSSDLDPAPPGPE
jgi:hypothetical protein